MSSSQTTSRFMPPDAPRPLPVRKKVAKSTSPSLSYAMQWFIFCAGLGIGYLVLVNRSLSSSRETQSAV